MSLNNYTHNTPSFDQIVEENLLRGLYLTQLSALTRCVRDPRMSARHAQVLAEIIERTNVKTGTAYPGRARMSQDVVYYVHGEPRHYSERSIGQTVSELIECGYIVAAKRAPVGGGRTLSHYAVTSPSVEDLKAAITDWCAKVKGQPRREFPAKSAVDDNTGVVVKPGDDNTGIDDNNRIDIANDDNAGVAVDDNTGTATVTGRLLTGKREGSDPADPSLPELVEPPKLPEEPSTESDFAIFWEAFPCGRKRGRGEALAVFRKVVSGKHKVGKASAAELIIAAKRYAATAPDPDYVPMPSTWLNQGRWMDDTPTAPVGPWWQDGAKLAAMTAERWRKGISEHAGPTWPVATLGPPPGSLNCVVPAHLVGELRLTDLYTDKGIRRR